MNKKGDEWMKDRIFKWLLVTGFLFCFHITDIMTVYANEEPLVNVSRQWLKAVIQDDQEEDIPDLKGGLKIPGKIVSSLLT